MKINSVYILVISLLIMGQYSCRKQAEWLDVKGSKAEVVPATLKDLQAILDNDAVMNQGYPTLGLLGADNHYIAFPTWQTFTSKMDQNTYIWAPDIFEGESYMGWNNQYKLIEYANVVLEQLPDISRTAANQEEWFYLKGSALFYRSMAFYNLAQLFAKPYVQTTADTEFGIPLRLTADVNEKSRRATLKETYDRIIGDLTEARQWVRIKEPVYKTRVSLPAITGLLAKVYHTMQNYEMSRRWSDSALQQASTLMDYNTVNPSINFPFPNLLNKHPEVIFWAAHASHAPLGGTRYSIDTSLYQSYEANDLRKLVFYKTQAGNIVTFKGNYTGNLWLFAGIATNELYCIQAEALARLGKPDEAIQVLNSLLLKRWKTGSYIDRHAASATDALNQILEERRKELPFTANLRWEDLRRLNLEGQYSKTLIRILNGQTFTLPPNSPLYTYPIPDDEILLSGMPQNVRQ